MSSAHEFDWRRASFEEVDRQYSPSQFARKPLDEYLADYAHLSSKVDPVYLLDADRPLLVYIHGGYWQQLSAADSLFVAKDAQRHGVSLFAVEYTLAPHATIDQMIKECVVAIVEISKRLSSSRVVVAGCSAGAHLAAMCAGDENLKKIVDAYVLLSGIYDLRPLVVTPTNEALRLDEAKATALSPLFLKPDYGKAKVFCAAAEYDPPEFIRQNFEFANHLQAHLVPKINDVEQVVVAKRDHFDLPYDLLDEKTIIGKWTLNELTRGK